MSLLGSIYVALILLISIILIYIISRLTLISRVQSGDIHTRELPEQFNKGIFVYLIMEIICTIVSVIPPVLSPVLFIISGLATIHDLTLYYKNQFKLPGSVLRKSLESIETRFELKGLIWIACFAYLIYLIILESRRIRAEIKATQLL